MQIIQNRRDFLVSTSQPGQRASLAPGARSPPRGRRRRRRSGWPITRTTAWFPCWWPRTCCAWKGSPTSATCLSRNPSPSRWSRAATSISPILSRESSCRTWMTACRSRGCPGFIPAATSCSRTSRSAPSASCGANVSPSQDLNSDGYYYLAIMAAHVGLDAKGTSTGFHPDGNPMELFAEGKADAFLAFPPEPQELRPATSGA